MSNTPSRIERDDRPAATKGFSRRALVASVGGAGLLAAGTVVLWPRLFPSMSLRAAGSQGSGAALKRSDAEWRKVLTDEQFRILRRGGTEVAYANLYHDHKEAGTYVCAGCGSRLFSSSAKFDSRTGWPSFYEPIEETAVLERLDFKLFLPRTEVVCRYCEGHLGHVFRDGPQPTGLRYCMNSAALKFLPVAPQ